MVDTLDKNLDFLTMPGKSDLEGTNLRMFIPIKGDRGPDDWGKTFFREVDDLRSLAAVSRGARMENTVEIAVQTPAPTANKLPPAPQNSGWARG